MRLHAVMMSPVATLAMIGLAAPATAQSQPAVATRVDRLEKEMRAVQRKVFPQGTPGYFEPEITQQAAPAAAAGVPASAPLADLTARVGSLEQALAQMTGQIEQQGFKQRQLEDSIARLRAETGGRLDALEGGAGAAAGGAPAGSSASPGKTPPAPAPSRGSDTNSVETDGPPAPPPPPSATASTSGDPSQAAYLAGYRLWDQKNYSGAEAALKDAVAKYPDGKWGSYSQNLLGRTYLDSNRPAAAAVAFHKNYTSNPRGERAPDSLYFLGQSLMKLDKPNPAKACEAYAAFDREYGATAAPGLKDKVKRAEADAKCPA